MIKKLSCLLLVSLVCSACQAFSVAAPPGPSATRAAVRMLDLSRVTLAAPPGSTLASARHETPSPIPANEIIPLASPTAARVPPATAALPTAQAASPINGAPPVGGLPPAAALTAPPVATCLNRAELVRHLSIALNTALDPLMSIGKVWQVRNTGDCTWTPAYSLVFDHGEAMQGPPALPLSGEIKPGQTLDLRVGLVTPQLPGEHAGYWLLQDPDGRRFGTGPSGELPLVVQILVRDPDAPPPYNFSCG